MTSIFDRDEFNDSLFYPREDEGGSPADAEDLFVEVGGARLHVRLHPARRARCTLLLFHGNGEIVADYDDAADVFARTGASLVVADYRGYGRSDGTPTLRDAIGDARTVAEAVRRARPASPLVVMGRSLGGAAAHELLARPIDGMVAVVLESAFFDVDGLIRRRGLAPPARYTPDELAHFDPATKLRLARLPLLLLHGELDSLIPHAEAEAALAAAGSADKTLVTVPGRGHNDVGAHRAYWDALAAFLTRVVPGA